MFRIRPGHMDGLAAQQVDGFAERMCVHLREVFPEEVAPLDEESLRLFVEKVRVQGEEWGMVQEQEVEGLIELFACFPELRHRPLPEWIGAIMEYPGRPGREILARLEEQLLFGEHS